jgi:hypothetical protein
MSPALGPIGNTYKKRFLREVYALAKKKSELERRQIEGRNNVRDLRTERIQMGRVRAHMYNALKSLEKAQRLCQGEWLRSLWDCFESDGSISFMKLIRIEIRDLLFWEDLNAAIIPPRLRTPIESRTSVRLPSKVESESPGFNLTWTDYWFIERVSQCLDSCRTATDAQLRPIDYERVISTAFMAAFSQRYDPRRVKTARRRIAERELQSILVSRQ